VHPRYRFSPSFSCLSLYPSLSKDISTNKKDISTSKKDTPDTDHYWKGRNWDVSMISCFLFSTRDFHRSIFIHLLFIFPFPSGPYIPACVALYYLDERSGKERHRVPDRNNLKLSRWSKRYLTVRKSISYQRSTNRNRKDLSFKNE